MTYSVALTFEKAALRFADSYVRAEYGPQGRSVMVDIKGIVDVCCWESMDSMPSWVVDNDPERKAWDEVTKEEEYYTDLYHQGKLWTVPPEENFQSVHYARMLSDVRRQIEMRFCP